MTYAKIIADSVSPEGVRLTTMEVRFHRFVLAEFNTHRVFSRNSASSRAIPLQKQIDRLVADPYVPVTWPAEQKGMQGGDEIEDVGEARSQWFDAAQHAINGAIRLGNMGVHKSLANRLLEPFMGHTVVVTSTAWENFFTQRCSPLAQPEIRVAAEMMREVMEASEPRPLREGEWHLPYIEPQDWDAISVAASSMQSPELDREMASLAAKVSAARCARVSYLTQDGKRDPQADLDLYERLTTAKPAHWSPLEHVATPWPDNRQQGSAMFLTGPEGRERYILTGHLPRVGNLLGWRSLRTEVEAQQNEVTYR